MQNMDILENYPKHMLLQCNFILKPYVQVCTELPRCTILENRLWANFCNDSPLANKDCFEFKEKNSVLD